MMGNSGVEHLYSSGLWAEAKAQSKILSVRQEKMCLIFLIIKCPTIAKSVYNWMPSNFAQVNLEINQSWVYCFC